jgi:hypothetical protein
MKAARGLIGPLLAVHFTIATSSAAVGAIDVVALSGMQAPDAPVGHLFREFDLMPSITSQGQIALSGNAWVELYGPATAGIWIDDGSGLKLAVSNHNSLPGVPSDVRLGNALPSLLHENGDLLVYGQLDGPSVTRKLSIWNRRADGLHLVARAGERPPESEPSGFQNIVPLGGTASGQVLFYNEQSVTYYSPSLWYYDNGVRRMIAREGSPAPHDPVRIVSHLPYSAYMQPNGDVKMLLLLDGADSPWQIVSGRPDAWEIELGTGMPAPGLHGANFRHGGGFTMNASGEVIVRANVSGGGIANPDNWGLWAGPPSDLRFVARVGDPAPEALSNFVFSEFRSLGLTDGGEASFIAHVSGPGVTTDNNTALYRWRDGQLDLVVQSGRAAPGLPAGYILHEILDYTANDVGQMVFSAYYVEGPGSFAGINVGLWAVSPDGHIEPVLVGGTPIEVAPGDIRTAYPPYGIGTTGGSIHRSVFNDSGRYVGVVGFSEGGTAVVAIDIPIPEPTSWALVVGALAIATLRRTSISARTKRR